MKSPKVVVFGALTAMMSSLLLGIASVNAIPDPGQPEALATLATCVATTHRLDVLMLIDESSSLVTDPAPGTDPEGRRVDGMHAAIDGLVRLSAKGADGNGVEVGLMFAGFADKFSPVGGSKGFAPVNPDTRDQLIGDAEGFRTRYSGNRTDFVTAVRGAINSFAIRSAERTGAGGPAPCKALVLFTDGVLYLGSKVANTVGVRALCAADGAADPLSDQTRTNGIITLVIALAGINPPKPNDDPLLLQRVARGTDDNGQICGTTGSAKTGLYLPVADKDQLVAYFANLFTEVAPPIRCTADLPCTGTFTLPSLVSSFRFSATVGDPSAQVTFRAPDGSKVTFSGAQPTSAAAGATTVDFQPSSATSFDVSATVTPSGLGDWTWTINYLAGKADSPQPTYTLSLISDIKAVVVSPQTIRPGRQSELTVKIEAADGSVVQEPNATVSVSLTDPTTATPTDVAMSGPNAQGLYTAQIGVGADSSAPYVDLALRADLPAAGDALIATPTTTARVNVYIPGSIKITPNPLHPPSITGTQQSSAPITATAPAEGAGCVWIEPGTLSSPRKGAVVEVVNSASSVAACVRVESGKSVQIPLAFKPDRPASGTAHGTLLVHTKADDPAVGERVVALNVTLAMTPAADVWWRTVAIIGSILMAVLLTLLTLHVIAHRGARFQDLNLILPWSTDVLVIPGVGIGPAEAPLGSDLIAPERGQLTPWVPRPASYRTKRHSGFNFSTRPSRLLAPRLRALFDGPFAEVQSSNSAPVTAGAATKENLRVRVERGVSDVPLALSGTWVFRRTGSDVIQTASGPVNAYRGVLLLLIGASGDTPDGNTMLIAAKELIIQRVGQMVAPTKHSSGHTPHEWPWRRQLRRKTPPSLSNDNPFNELLND